MPGGISTTDYNVAMLLAAMELTIATKRTDPQELADAYKIIYRGMVAAHRPDSPPPR